MREFGCSEGAFCPWITLCIPCNQGTWVHHPDSYACPKDRTEALQNKRLWLERHPYHELSPQVPAPTDR